MGGLLKFDSPLMQFLTKVADLLWVNILVLVCSVPIITIGASFTAMQTIFYRILHNEDVLVTREFFAAFKRNFKQATLIWLILLPILLFLIYDFVFLGSEATYMGIILRAVSAVLLFVIASVIMYIFAWQSRYDNTLKETFRNAFTLAVSHPIRTVIMLLILAACVVLEILMPFKMFPLLVAFGISVPWYFCSMVYMPLFDKIEGIERPGRRF